MSTELRDEANTLRGEIKAANEGYAALLAKMEREHKAEVVQKEAGVKAAQIGATDATGRAQTVFEAARLL